MLFFRFPLTLNTTSTNWNIDDKMNRASQGVVPLLTSFRRSVRYGMPSKGCNNRFELRHPFHDASRFAKQRQVQLLFFVLVCGCLQTTFVTYNVQFHMQPEFCTYEHVKNLPCGFFHGIPFFFSTSLHFTKFPFFPISMQCYLFVPVRVFCAPCAGENYGAAAASRTQVRLRRRCEILLCVL